MGTLSTPPRRGSCALLEVIMVIMMIGMLILVGINVGLRIGFNTGIDYAEEVPRFMFIWLIFCGAVVAMKQNTHINVSMFVHMVPRGVQKLFYAITQILVIVCGAYITYGTILLNDIVYYNASPVLQMSMLYVYGVTYIAGPALLLIAASNLIRLALNRVSDQELAEKHEDDPVELAARELKKSEAKAAAQAGQLLPATRPTAASGRPAMTLIIYVTTLLFFVAIGTPISFALLGCALALMCHLGMTDPQIVVQNMWDGANSFPLLAVPFFMLAGEFMNAGGMTSRIIKLAMAWVGHIRGGLGYVAVDRRDHHGLALRLGGRRHRRAGRHPAADDEDRRLRHAALGRPDRRRRHHRPGHPAVDRHDPARRLRPGLDRQALPRRHRPRHPDGHRHHGYLVRRRAQGRRGGRSQGADAHPPDRDAQGLLGAAAADHHHRRPQDRLLHADRGGGDRRRLLALRRPVHLPRDQVPRTLRTLPVGRQDHRHRPLPGRRRVGLGLAGHRGQHPEQLGEVLQPFMHNKTLLMIVLMLLGLVMGCVLDFTPNILIMTPVLIPIVIKAGIDPVYFGVVYILNQCLGLITPPVGAVLNVISTIGRMPMNKVAGGVLPFLLAESAVLLLLVHLPRYRAGAAGVDDELTTISVRKNLLR